MKLAGKHVAILGVGRSGRAAARLAMREGARVSAWDTAGEGAFAGMPEGVETHSGVGEEDGSQVACDCLVVSPGIDTYGSFVGAYAKGAGEVIGEVELASRLFSGKIVGITGTNGKTTTTELISKILAKAGFGGDACGNYGTPFAEVIMSDVVPQAVALELSSFQLETIQSLKPDVAVWLNFAPDHMDRYPTEEAYRAAKLRIFENMGPEQVAVVRAGERLGELRCRVVEFSTDVSGCEWYSDGEIVWRKGEQVLNLRAETALRGLHNAENVMAAMAACEALGVEVGVMKQALQGVSPPPHRCELIRTLDGVEYLNDSKATNLHALESALRSQTRPVVLIAGGKDKGLDYEPALGVLAKKVVGVVTFGQISRSLGELFGQVVPVRMVDDLAAAVNCARELAPRGSTVLLSPGTSSYDQFSGYEQRGDVFRELVHQLK